MEKIDPGVTGRKISDKVLKVVQIFDDLPRSAIVETNVTSLITSLSPRSIRYHPRLRQYQISRGRKGQNVGEIRDLMSGESNAA